MDSSATDEDRIDEAAAGWIARRDDGLSAPDQAEFERWLAADPRHAAALARFDATWAALSQPRQAGATGKLSAELNALGRQRRRRITTGAFTAVLALCILGGALWQFSIRGGESPAAVARVSVVQPLQQTLPDGSTVFSADGTTISVDFTETRRRVILPAGKAHFEVAKDRNRPFVVEVGGIEVRAVGTAFTVQRGGTQIEILVTEGEVAVERAVPPGATETSAVLARLTEGKIVSLDASMPEGLAAPAVLDVPTAEITQRLAWRKPRLEFSSVPLAQVIETVNRHSPVKFTVVDPELGRIPLSGVFSAEDTDAIVQMLTQVFGASVERRHDEIRVRRAR